jgi:hypothetical protein
MADEQAVKQALEEWLRLAPKPPAVAEGEGWNVFLSYRSVNRTWVLHLYDALRQAGFRVFLDQLEIPAGDSLTARLNSALKSSRSGVIVWSTEYGDSEWCKKEYETMETLAADRKGFKFVVAKLGNVELDPLVRREVFVDFTDYPDGPQGSELLKLMYGTLGQSLSNEALRKAQALDDETKAALSRIHAAGQVKNVDRLRELAATGGVAWQASPLLYSAAAEALIELGENDGALAVLDIAGRQFKNAIRPIQLKALALARKGQLAKRRAGDEKTPEAERAAARTEAAKLLQEAQEMLAVLFDQKHRDPETLGIYARTWMDLYNLEGKRVYLEKSRDMYALAFKLDGTNSYTGVNAAAKSVFLGDLAAAATYAAAVEPLVGKVAMPGKYWETATAAEVQLIKGNYDLAAALYRSAVVDAPNATANHDTSRTQAERLLAQMQPPPGAREKILDAFKVA